MKKEVKFKKLHEFSKFIILRNIDIEAGIILNVNIKRLNYQHHKDFSLDLVDRSYSGNDVVLVIYNRTMLEDPRIKELLLEYII